MNFWLEINQRLESGKMQPSSADLALMFCDCSVRLSVDCYL